MMGVHCTMRNPGRLLIFAWCCLDLACGSLVNSLVLWGHMNVTDIGRAVSVKLAVPPGRGLL